MIFQLIMPISAFAVIISEYLSKMSKADGIYAQLQSWTVAVAIAMLGNWANIGYFESLSWGESAIAGVLAGFVSNGVFDISVVQAFLVSIGARKV